MRAFLAFTLLFLWAAAAHAAPPLRPVSGCGVLALHSPPGEEARPLVLYQEPGVARLAEVAVGALPRLGGSAAAPLVAATARKGGWDRVAYDEAGREGWIEQPRSSRCLSWTEFLPGRWVRILPGLKKGYYALKSQPGDGPETGSVTRDQEVQVLRVEEDWALLLAPAGWFRWRDGDGRLTISVQE